MKSKISTIINEQEFKLLVYFFKLFLIWLSWQLIMWVLGRQADPIEERMFPTISTYWESFNLQTVKFILGISKNILQGFGYETYHIARRIWVEGHSGLAMGNYCIGLQLTYFYIMIVLIATLSVKRKILGVIIGIIATLFIDILRIVGLTLVDVHIPQYMVLAHDHLFNIVVFGSLIGIYILLHKVGEKA